MANNNDYNYYKSEYSKFKGNYYTPGSNNNNNKGSGGKSFKRFLRAFLVFLVTFGIIAAAVFGGIKLYRSIAEKKQNEAATTTSASTETTTSENNETTAKKPDETTTEEKTTTEPETTTAAPSSKVTAGTVAVVKTPDNTGIYLRYNPTYDEGGFVLLKDGTNVVISEISSDGLWAKSSNFDINGWVYLKYLVSSSGSALSADKSASATTGSSSSDKSSEKLTFGEALTIFGNDTSRNLYMNCKINSSSKVSGIADYQNPDSKVIATFSNGQSVPIYSVRSGYGKTRVNGIETWIPTQYLDFESWGHYR